MQSPTSPSLRERLSPHPPLRPKTHLVSAAADGQTQLFGRKHTWSALPPIAKPSYSAENTPGQRCCRWPNPAIRPKPYLVSAAADSQTHLFGRKPPVTAPSPTRPPPPPKGAPPAQRAARLNAQPLLLHPLTANFRFGRIGGRRQCAGGSLFGRYNTPKTGRNREILIASQAELIGYLES